MKDCFFLLPEFEYQRLKVWFEENEIEFLCDCLDCRKMRHRIFFREAFNSQLDD